jgi:hypothetical protein
LRSFAIFAVKALPGRHHGMFTTQKSQEPTARSQGLPS